jgi:diguanylate cyclase
MKNIFIVALILAMMILGVISGYIFYILFVKSGDTLIFGCIIAGFVFGLLNALVALFAIKNYSIVKPKQRSLGNKIRVDVLTKLYNRYAFENDIRAFNPDMVYSMIYMNVDNFNEINDSYGKDIGDKILNDCAEIIRNCIRYSDIAYRYGEEELVIILIGCDKTEAEKIGQNIVDRIHNFDNEPYCKLVMSSGTACMPGDAQTFEQLIEASALALLKTKENASA